MNPSIQTHPAPPRADKRAALLAGPPLANPIAALDEESLASAADTDQTTAQVQATTEWLGVRVGPIGLLLPATAARELLDPPPTARLPHTPPWFAGLANVRGTLVPVVDTAQALEVAPDAAARRYLLIFGQGDESLGLIVDGLPRRQGFEARERTNGLPPHPMLLDGHLAGAYGRDGLLWFEIVLDSLLETLARRMASVE